MKIEFKIAEDVAIEEIKDFVDYHTDEEMELDAVKAKYPSMVKAIRRGLLVFDNNHAPVYTLIEPVLNTNQEIALSEIKFRTRIPASEQQRLSKGLNMKTDAVSWGFKCMGYIIQQPVIMLDKISKHDNKVIEEVAGLFF